MGEKSPGALKPEVTRGLGTRGQGACCPTGCSGQAVDVPARDRLALGVGWVRPGAADIGGTLNPSPRPPVCVGVAEKVL